MNLSLVEVKKSHLKNLRDTEIKNLHENHLITEVKNIYQIKKRETDFEKIIPFQPKSKRCINTHEFNYWMDWKKVEFIRVYPKHVSGNNKLLALEKCINYKIIFFKFDFKQILLADRSFLEKKLKSRLSKYNNLNSSEDDNQSFVLHQLKLVRLYLNFIFTYYLKNLWL